MANLPWESEIEGLSPHSYKAQWAKNLVLEDIKQFWLSRPKGDPAWERIIGKPPTEDEIKAGKLPELPDVGREDTDLSPYKICIIGAGVAGLFTAMIIDRLNEKFDLGFEYDILEAADETRFGGRLYTHRFTENLHDYYDVGAMRFPEISIMKRTFDLFLKELKFAKKDSPEELKFAPKARPGDPDEYAPYPLPEEVKLIPYYLSGDKCPQYYNDLHYPSPPKNVKDPFQVQSNRGDEKIPEKWLNLGSEGPGQALNEAIKEIKDKLREDAEKQDPNGPGWQELMKVDTLSVRQFLSQKNPVDYNYRTIEWMETFGSGTLNFDESISELIIGSLDFDYWSGDPDPKKKVKWWCIEGGTDQVATKMRKTLKGGDVKFNQRVTMVRRVVSISGHNDVEIRVGPAKDKDEEKEDLRQYAAVFSTGTLASLQRMDLTDAYLNYGTKVAIRALRYGTSCKVGIKFSHPWWIEDGTNKGGVGYTDLPLRVCVYPSYNIKDKGDAVLLCSYTWGQDASRFAALISKQKKYEVKTPETPDPEEELKNLLIENLTLLHSPQKNGSRDNEEYDRFYKKIRKAYKTHHAYDWGADPFMSGAFAHFGPGQFSKLYPEVITPSAGGKLFIIGEAASKHHAWIVGALESAVRGVYQLLFRYKGAKALNAKKAIEWLKSEDSSPYGPLPTEEETEELVRHQVYIADIRERAKRGVRIQGHNI